MHLVLEPGAIILPLVCPGKYSFAIKLIISELSDINTSIFQFKSSLALFQAILEVAVVLSAIRVCLESEPVLLVESPITYVLEQAIMSFVSAEPMRPVVQPFSLVAVTIGVNESAPAIRHIVLPVANVLGSILPHLAALTLA